MEMLLERKMRILWGFVSVFICCVLGEVGTSVSARNCTADSPLVGLSSDFVMVQHQLRGSVAFVDDCTFKVTRFDMISGIDVYWWGSFGDDFDNMTEGFSVSPNKLNQTYQNDTLEVTLDSNYTWNDFKVLSVWDRYSGSDFGHVFLQVVSPEAEIGPAPQSGLDFGSPGPAPAPGPEVSWISGASPPTGANESTPEIIGHSQPTMFDNCVSLKDTYRLRWTVNWDSQTVDLGLESALIKSQYMAFGWAKPGVTTGVMLQSDVVVAGIDEKDIPYAEDYYLGNYAECNWDYNNPSGVCPDYVYTGATGSNANSNTLLYGQQIDGITLIRYRRPLLGVDTLYDVAINTSDPMLIVWATGNMKPPDLTKGNRTPQNHGPSNYNYRTLTLGDTIDECLGPMVAENVYLGNVVVADRGSTVVVGADTSSHYPDPPFPEKVFYINQKEAPLLKVERGVLVTFSVQAGHGLALYITDNPVGGASNTSEIIYAGGPGAHGVPTTPYTLTWQPNRTTPDLVYYQDYFMQKRGWKVQVMDGGLSDMYNRSAPLADSRATLFWTVSRGRIYLAVRGEVKSGYLAIAFGSGMVNSFSYVGWVDGQGVPHINGYWMDGKRASSIHATEEQLTDQKCESNQGIISFEFSRPLQPICNKGVLCKNVIDPKSPLKVVWAMGDAWTADTLADSNMHTAVSTRPTLVHLLSGDHYLEELQPVLAVHGFMMFIAWGILLPSGVLGARYLKHLANNGWLEIHIYSQLSAIVVMLLGLLFAIAELHGFNFRTAHMKVGLLSILVALLQASNGYLRPKNAAPGESQRPKRVIWQYIHMYTGRSSLILGFLSLVTGISQLAKRDGVEHLKGLQWALFAWFLAVAAVVGYIEVQGFWSKQGHDAVAFDAILGVADDSQNLLSESHGPYFPGSGEMQSSTARGMEIQLEALH